MKQQLIAISGPSCGGKTTLKETLLRLGGDRLVEIITTTTRMSRPGESDNGSYRFCSEDAFRELVSKEHLLEWIRYDGNYYGIEFTSLNNFHDSEQCGVVVATEDGVAALSKWCVQNGIELVRVLATAPVDELLRRLDTRSDSSAAAARRRERLLVETSGDIDFSKYDWIVDPAFSESLMELAAAVHQ